MQYQHLYCRLNYFVYTANPTDDCCRPTISDIKNICHIELKGEFDKWTVLDLNELPQIGSVTLNDIEHFYKIKFIPDKTYLVYTRGFLIKNRKPYRQYSGELRDAEFMYIIRFDKL